MLQAPLEAEAKEVGAALALGAREHRSFHSGSSKYAFNLTIHRIEWRGAPSLEPGRGRQSGQPSLPPPRFGTRDDQRIMRSIWHIARATTHRSRVMGWHPQKKSPKRIRPGSLRITPDPLARAALSNDDVAFGIQLQVRPGILEAP